MTSRSAGAQTSSPGSNSTAPPPTTSSEPASPNPPPVAAPRNSPQSPPVQSPPVQPPPVQTPEGQPQQLDKVIAIINGDVLLQSDVLEEMQFSSLLPLSRPGETGDTAAAGRRLINRTLILQQMKRQQADIPVSDETLQQGLADLRRQIPACVRFHCDTPQGWRDYLQQSNLSEQQLADRWRQRMQIEQFIDSRFRSGVRIPKEEVQNYYDKTFVPAFQKESAKPPALPVVAPRIEEILLQKKVNVMLQDWMKSLHDQGSVEILDPIYGVSSESNDGGAE